MSLFQLTDIGLAQARSVRQRFLCQPAFLSQASEVGTDDLADIHDAITKDLRENLYSLYRIIAYFLRPDRSAQT
jgi:hypothetical protein